MNRGDCGRKWGCTMEDNKKTKLFREKSLEAVESPEALNDYLRVTSPGVWLVLAAVVALLVGGILWGVFGRIETKRQAAIVTTEGKSICCVSFESFDQLEVIAQRRSVEIGGQTYALDIPETGEMELGFVEEFVTEESRLPMTYAKGGLAKGDLVVCLPVAAELEDGVQSGLISTETLQPLSFLFQ